jgi:transcription initiation factor TFIIB
MLVLKNDFSKERLIQRGICPECGSKDLITDIKTGEIACKECALVIEDVKLNEKPEWRAFTLEEISKKKRVGSPTSLSVFDKGLYTTFRPRENASGGLLSTKKRFKMQRLKRWDYRARLHNSKIHNLSQATTELDRLSDRLNIPRSVKEEAALIYRKVLQEDLIRGRSIASVVAASLYLACRLTETPRRLEDIVKLSTKNRKEISRNYRVILKELGLRIPIDEPTKYISKIAFQAGLNQKIQNTAIDLLRKARSVKATTGKNPAGLAAAALYIASNLEGEKVTQRDIAEASGVTEVTVRNRYKGLATKLEIKL